MVDRISAAEAVCRQCFWGDYNLDARQILEKLDESETGFREFLFSKIMENSLYPSRHLKILFDPNCLKRLLDRYLERNAGSRRARLVAANFTGDYNLVPEYRWLK